ncbi:MAG: hypothetical protein ABEJ92_10470, partial [Halobacteriales archaeon]
MRPSAGQVAAAAVLLALLGAGLSAPAAGQSGAPTTVLHVSLQPDGDARWTVSARYPLGDANRTTAFDRLADEFVAGETAALSADPFRSAAARASEATGRPMAIRNVDRATGRDDETGELRLAFTWTNFSRVEAGGERLVLGDVFTTPSGTWLPALQAGQVLVIEFPEGYVVDSVSRGLDNRSIRVVGPATFDPGQPSATLVRSGPPTTSSDTPTTPGAGVPSALSIGAALAIVLVAGYLVYRRGGVEPDDEPEEPVPAAEAEEAAAEPVDEELLSDEERVLRLLRERGG